MLTPRRSQSAHVVERAARVCATRLSRCQFCVAGVMVKVLALDKKAGVDAQILIPALL